MNDFIQCPDKRALSKHSTTSMSIAPIFRNWVIHRNTMHDREWTLILLKVMLPWQTISTSTTEIITKTCENSIWIAALLLCPRCSRTCIAKNKIQDEKINGKVGVADRLAQPTLNVNDCSIDVAVPYVGHTCDAFNCDNSCGSYD